MFIFYSCVAPCTNPCSPSLPQATPKGARRRRNTATPQGSPRSGCLTCHLIGTHQPAFNRYALCVSLSNKKVSVLSFLRTGHVAMCSARIPFATLSGECRKSCSAVCCFSSCTPLYPEEGIATRLTCRLRGLSPVGSGPPHAPLLWSGVGLLIFLISPPRKGERLRVSTTYLIPGYCYLGIKFGAPYNMWNHVIRCAKYVFIHFGADVSALASSVLLLCIRWI